VLTQIQNGTVLFDSRRCCQCGVCLAACPHGAITAFPGKQQYDLRIEPAKCTRCGLCVKICPAHDVSKVRIPADILTKATGFYVAAAHDERVRRCASSGGVARVLLSLGMCRHDLSAVYTLLFPDVTLDERSNLTSIGAEAVGVWSESPPDVFRIPSSLYRPVLWGTGLRTGLPRTGRVLLVGLPCQIRAASRLLASLCPGVHPVCVSLFCRKTKDFGYSRYILQMARCEHEPIYRVLYRGGGWPGRFRVLSENGLKDVGPFFYHALCWNATGCRYCVDCIGRGVSDLTVGDPWGIISPSGERPGMTLVYAWTRVGRELLDSCKESLDMRTLTIEQVEAHFSAQATRVKEAMVERRVRYGGWRSAVPLEREQLKARMAERLLSFHPHSGIMKRFLRHRTIAENYTA
jgi:coenzyme F420 hydrogenase subunit beta